MDNEFVYIESYVFMIGWCCLGLALPFITYWIING